MTRFVFLTDTHLGAVDGVGYIQQPRYADRLGELLSLLDSWIARQDGPPIDFVLHGGDMLDTVNEANLASACRTFDLSVPVYLALGNHDLTEPSSDAMWLSKAPGFFPGGRPAYSLSGPGWMLHVLPTQWCDIPYTWTSEQRPHFLPEHLADLEVGLQAYPDRAHLICTHGEVLPVPAAQIGRPEPDHPPLQSYHDAIADLVARHPQVRAILGGHNHINTYGTVGEAHAVTASAFTETPFEIKVFDVQADHISMTTVSLLPLVSFRAGYNWDKTFVQGRRCDRTFSWVADTGDG